MIAFIILFCGILIGCLLKLLDRANKKIDTALIIKILSVLLFTVITARCIINKPPIYSTRGLNMHSPFGDDIFKTIIGLILPWFTYSVVILTVLYSFFKINNVKNYLKFFGVIVIVLDLAFLETYILALADHAFTQFDIRAFLCVIELILTIALIIYLCVDKTYLRISKKEVVTLSISIVPILLAIMPAYTLQGLLGFNMTAGISLKDFSLGHRICIYLSFIIPFIIYHVFKNKSYEIKRFAMIYLSIATLWTFMIRFGFAEWKSFETWPLHLCNTAMYILPICLVFRFKKVFFFTFFINVLGAFLALLMPNFDSSYNMFAYQVYSFYINHWFAFFMPVLVVSLNVFERPKLKDWIISMVAFLVYFVFVIFVNAYFNTDFFYINGDFILNKLGEWTDFTTKVVWAFDLGGKTLKFMPIYQSLFFLVYVSLSVGMWFIYEQLFIMWDNSAEFRLKKKAYRAIKREFEISNKCRGEEVGDPIPCLELRNFSKKYGSNKHYAVNNVSLKIEGGVIFGFLGHNGAGKSTIIKSVVGIQSKTSGKILVCGYDTDMEAPMAKKQIGFVPDHYALYENLTGREYINFIADLYGVSKELRDERIEKYLTNFQLHDAFDNQMKTYSHGMKQKIAIMAALIHNPKVWILDEPLTGLDPNSIFQVKECMKEHASQGNIVFFSSHIIDVVEKICDKIAIIKKGVLQCVTDIKELEREGATLEQFYLSITGDQVSQTGEIV